MESKRKESQIKQIKRYLELHKCITPLEALDHFGCFRLADVIYKLRSKGWDIRTYMIKHDGLRYANYVYISTDMP